MAKAAAAAAIASFAAELGSSFVADIHNVVVDAAHVVAFNSDGIGRRREIDRIVREATQKYHVQGLEVNVAVWNMHVTVESNFHDVLQTGCQKMGKGGGFIVTIFAGSGSVENDHHRGFENWRCDGNQTQNGSVVTFLPTGNADRLRSTLLIIRAGRQLQSLSDDDCRNGLIVYLNEQGLGDVPVLQGRSNYRLCSMFESQYIWLALRRTGYPAGGGAGESYQTDDGRRNAIIAYLHNESRGGYSVTQLQGMSSFDLCGMVGH